ncbi:MAG: Gfo/Idh/MocA family oxidoreductase [Anaerolineaceae bacterium]|nr:Gfo/Idh/MocA family oxidoreductase [Anaerolineaceae bacterium]
MTQIRAALIGTGVIVGNHMQALAHEAERVELVAAVDTNSDTLKRFAETYGVQQLYSDTAQMLAEQQPDLVMICTPPATHAALCIQALEANAHVLCEKPIAASLAVLDTIQDVERRSGRTCTSVFQWRYGSSGQHVKHLIEQGVFGKSLVGVCHTLWYRDDAYYAVPWRGKWQTELGGVSTGQGIHAMDFFLWLMGEWEVVQALVGTLNHAIDIEDVSLAQVRFQQGGLGSIVNSLVSPRQTSYIRLDFQRATVELEHLYHYRNHHWRFSIPEGAPYQDELAAWSSLGEDVEAHQTAQLTALLDALERGERPLTSGAELRHTVEFLASLYKSAFTRQPVERGSIGPDDPFYSSMTGAALP